MSRKLFLHIPPPGYLDKVGFLGGNWESQKAELLAWFPDGLGVAVLAFGDIKTASGEVERFTIQFSIEDVSRAVAAFEQMLSSYTFPNGTRLVEICQNDSGQDYLYEHLRVE